MERLFVAAASDRLDQLPLKSIVDLAARLPASINWGLFASNADVAHVDPMAWSLSQQAGTTQGAVNEYGFSPDAIRERVAGIAAELNVTAPQSHFEGLASADMLGQRTRLFDLVLMSREGLQIDWMTGFETVLFQGGRPVIMVPGNWTGSIGKVITIAWNRSAETARLVAKTLELLEHADAVHVLESPNWGVPGPDGAELCDYLADHGVNVELHQMDAKPSTAAGVVLKESQRLGADLICKGAYTQGRLSQAFFGGATRDILDMARMPVVFAQ